MAKVILIIGTMDTKGQEVLFLRDRIRRRGCEALLLDAGILGPPDEPADVSREEVALAGGSSVQDLLAANDKGRAIACMIRGARELCAELHRDGRFDGAVSLGGAQGAAIGSAALRDLPRGVPKLVVSPVISGTARCGSFVGTSDLTLMHSVADLQGINSVTARVLTNAAGAICGMVQGLDEELPRGKPSIALSMLGTTTPGALAAMRLLERRGYEVVAFHQNGTGGTAMEEMVDEGSFDAVLDLNLHEIADREFQGLHRSLVATRLEAAGARGLPQVVAPGSINYYVLGPLETLSDEVRIRKHIVHNPELTLVRASAEELGGLGALVAEKLNRAHGRVEVVIPRQGFCFPDRQGEPLHDPAGNDAFIAALASNLRDDIPVQEVDAHINDPEFSELAVERLLNLLGAKQTK